MAEQAQAQAQLRREISSAFKLSGFTLRREAGALLAARLAGQADGARARALDALTGHLLARSRGLAAPALERADVERALRECAASGRDEGETALQVIGAFDVPRLRYHAARHKFLREDSAAPQLFPGPEWKARCLLDRYDLIWQRTVRNKLFATESVPGSETENHFLLRKIEVLLSSSSKIDEAIVLGLLTQLTEGTFYLEDPTGSVPLDMTHTTYHSGLFTENSFVIAEGHYDDKVLHVKHLVLPPSESRATSMPYFGSLNTFGGNSKTLLKNSKNLLKVEQENEDRMIIFLSDVWFDNFKVMNKLKTLFSGCEEYPPIAIVLMGEFLSCPYGSEHSIQLKAAFANLAELIFQYPKLRENCKFIFVPGCSDPAAPNILPRPPIPNYIIKEIQEKLGDSVIFTTNPCRIQYCTQEIVVMRQDLVTKLCRNSIHFPEAGDIPDHITKTLLSQCTLSPLSIGVQPVFWKHADALNLYPMPDLVVVADHFQPYTKAYQDCQVINPGSFPRTEYSFKVYIPSSRTVDDSEIKDDEEDM